jgi:cyclase
VELAAEYATQGADELVFLDVLASHESRRTLFDVVAAVARAVFVPLAVGGGIASLQDIAAALAAGADKVSLCSAALREPALLTRAAARFGSQCIVLSVDAARSGAGWCAFSHGGRRDSGRDVVAWVREAVERGAGEVLLNSIDRDGAQQGYDLDLCRAVSAAVRVPLIASGGAGRVADMAAAVHVGGADAVLVASLLHSGACTIGQIKNELQTKGVHVR